MDFIKKYNSIAKNNKAFVEFVSNAVNKDKRVFRLWNSNIKTLSTYYKYLNDIIFDPEGDNHQKYKILRSLRLYADKENNKVKARQQIALKINELELERGEHIKALGIFFLSLNSEYPIEKGSEFIMDTLSPEMIADYKRFLSELNDDVDTYLLNPYFMAFVLYSNKELLDEFIDSFPLKGNEVDFIYKEYETKGTMLNKRIKDCQIGSFKKEANFLGYYFTLCEIDFNGITGYENIVDILISTYKNSIKEFDPMMFPYDNDWEKFKDLLLELNKEERFALLEALGNVSSSAEVFERSERSKRIVQRKSTIKAGEDIFTTSKRRRGQSTFRNELLKDKLDEGCRLCHCNVKQEEYLIASHILDWNLSDEVQKIDKDNGLLLCPVHDYLFDRHLISFNDDGTIVISSKFDESLYATFNIDEDSRINITEGNIPYMKKHREKLK